MKPPSPVRASSVTSCLTDHVYAAYSCSCEVTFFRPFFQCPRAFKQNVSVLKTAKQTNSVADHGVQQQSYFSKFVDPVPKGSQT